MQRRRDHCDRPPLPVDESTPCEGFTRSVARSTNTRALTSHKSAPLVATVVHEQTADGGGVTRAWRSKDGVGRNGVVCRFQRRLHSQGPVAAHSHNVCQWLERQ